MRSVHCFCFIIALGATAISISPGAAAQAPPATPEAPSKAQAQAQTGAAGHYDAGRVAQQRSDWTVAYSEYAKAYALFQHPQILVSLGVAELRVGKYRDAAEHLARFLAAPPAKLPAEERAQYTRHLADARAHVALLTITTEPGTRVSVAGKHAGTAGDAGTLELFVDPGAHEIVARLGETRGARQSITTKAGTTLDLTLQLAGSPAEAKPPPGGPAVAPNAPPATTASLVSSVPRHSPAIPAAGAESTTPSTGLLPPAPTNVPDSAGPSRAVLVTGGVLTAIGLGVGLGTMAAGLAVGGEADALRKEISPEGDSSACLGKTGGKCGELLDLARQENMLLGAAIGSSAGGLVLGVATLVYARVTRSKPPPEKGLVVVPAAGQSAGGLVVRGVW